MFTGIVEEIGKVKGVQNKGNSSVLTIECNKVLENTNIGDSISVNGVCLTVATMGNNFFSADVSYETLNKSSLKYLKNGDVVNLERALTLTTRLGGHLVLGHVDGIGVIKGLRRIGESYILTVSYPEHLDRYIAEKGSVSVDGISLTVAEEKSYTFDVAVIPHTFESTALKYKKVGDYVNLEVDVIARYLEKLLKKEEKTSKLYENVQYLKGLEDF
ncbi:riboflavin synthase [Deferribacter autotrophicus]|uniref:Riboflavin synthase n=1 Tax=Deferribacter autotrophicus TaxID=500465 RepID=A0A5A8F5B9_9BACT|nr:riboflavin synthase [Deferribacter autotrophicus]KAA0259316.1 riboflavin synthase [Deferribacter autotrophicus]